MLSQTGSTINPFFYVGESGYYHDSEMNSYYIRARIYEPRTTRWWSRDPAEADRDNLFRYVGNIPVDYTDPSGEDIIAILDPKALDDVGHVALIVGRDNGKKKGWWYFSFARGCIWQDGDLTVLHGRTMEELHERIGKTPSSEGKFGKKRKPSYRYTEYARWRTSEGQERNAIETARTYGWKAYHITTCNCAVMVQDALKSANVPYYGDQTTPKIFFNKSKGKAFADDTGAFPELIKMYKRKYRR